jgi:acyl-coenzyme A synthetase/AMP-(fatty) acid ligase
MDTWWQTETGGFMITPTPAVPLKPGSGTLPFAGVQADVVREDGSSCDANEDGYLVHQASVAGHGTHRLGRSAALCRHLLG